MEEELPIDPTYQQLEAERRQSAVDIAVLKEQVANLTTTLESMASQMSTLTHQMADVSTTLAEARGGWRTLMWAGGAASAVGSLVGWLAHMFHIAPKG